jgi:hypothetical protein
MIRGVLLLLAGVCALDGLFLNRANAQPGSVQPSTTPQATVPLETSAKSNEAALPLTPSGGAKAADDASGAGTTVLPGIAVQLAGDPPPPPKDGQPPVAAPVAPATVRFDPRCPTPMGQLWGSVEYLLWWTKGSPLPPLLTTAPPGAPPDTAGTLGTPGTAIVLGDEFVNAGVRSGGRFSLGGWFNADRTTGVEASFFILGGVATHFLAGSNGNLTLARPFINEDPTSPFFRTNDSLFVSFAGGPKSVRGFFQADTTGQLLGSDIFLRQALACAAGWRVDALVGYRFLRLREGLQMLDVEISNDPANPLFGVPFILPESFATTNLLHGGELGLIGDYQRDRWFLHVVGKVAFGSTNQAAWY